MAVLWLIIIGAAAGFLATRIMGKETNIIATMAIGIGGALIGGFVLRLLLAMLGAAAGFIGAILGALVLIWLWDRYFG
ncbi:GlsB/YeaQ/YmgE family stress response membrane protein [Aquicoccus sp. G2-2]|uniref:GlsB/YeaQ/YmgE family stress response membrane protein n=1 Tax=Aquicoccus sp. G2-2 TaxID=3092120 RepID=UPI002ADFC140|nr:GlsB/YeaQ/YmgE family stress response membrane protein [Aquicoccus sp. G2-2]MEA1114064.1 GlsB/YeaQ/YmgE family stress response membrane protein [Aquicoccus sp. G2-2]